jgi:hypothetical protein
VVKRSNASIARGHHLMRDYEQLAETRADWHFMVCATLLLKRLAELLILRV